MTTLTEFLLARIAEDEARAEKFERDYGHAKMGTYGRGGMEQAEPRWSSVEAIGFTPARVLAECEAKRRIVELHQPHDSVGQQRCGTCADPDDDLASGAPWPCDTIRALAAIYEDNND